MPGPIGPGLACVLARDAATHLLLLVLPIQAVCASGHLHLGRERLACHAWDNGGNRVCANGAPCVACRPPLYQPGFHQASSCQLLVAAPCGAAPSMLCQRPWTKFCRVLLATGGGLQRLSGILCMHISSTKFAHAALRRCAWDVWTCPLRKERGALLWAQRPEHPLGSAQV